MFLEYNGVQLNLLTLDSVDRQAIWTSDKTDILYVRWLIGVSCVYAGGTHAAGTFLTQEPSGTSGPSSTSLDTFKGIGTSPSSPLPYQGREGSQTWVNPLLTDLHLRKLLFRNRKKLRIWGYNPNNTGNVEPWVESPVDPSTSDADNGPKVHACNIVSATGSPGSLGVQMEIETCLPPVWNDKPILGHRWQMTHGHDENNYLTRTVVGEAVFHPGLMDKFAQSPDWFRRQLFHPIPLGFRRKLGDISLSPDGCILKYEYSDTDPTIMFNDNGALAANIDIKETFQYIPGNWASVVKG